jgi:18S rRNA (guanine1575-N7)-methyltransferase
LFAGASLASDMPTALGVDDANAASSSASAQFVRARDKRRSKARRKNVKDVDWLLSKKERRRAQGKKTAADSKYSGRRRARF